jgi:hypothetical protein
MAVVLPPLKPTDLCIYRVRVEYRPWCNDWWAMVEITCNGRLYRAFVGYARPTRSEAIADVVAFTRNRRRDVWRRHGTWEFPAGTSRRV